MPSDLKQKLDWFFENFDLKEAARGEFEPSPGMSEDYDNALEAIENIKRELDAYRIEMCDFLKQGTKSTWKYINTKEDAKDKYLIELPASVNVPAEFKVKGKRGKGNNQVNKYLCPDVDRLVQDMERAIDIKNEAKSLGMKMVFAKFAALSATWNAAVHASAMLGKIKCCIGSSFAAPSEDPRHYLNTQMLLDHWQRLQANLDIADQSLLTALKMKDLL
jgi:DNA mismatch repair protein MSH6